MKVSNTFSRLLLAWYKENGRNYVWRHKSDPYEILIAEIMLQRTKADQVEPVYISFLEQFPTPEELNRASEEEIGTYFRKLGLLWRTALLKRFAEELLNKFGGRIPESRNRLLSLPAVGEYMADAVLSFAFGKDVAVVDANVCRIIGRVFGLKARGEARRDRRFRRVAQQMLPAGRAKEFNWAMIDFAALVCRPHDPKCSTCPLSKFCTYHQKLKNRNN